ncbi:hypothetical protein SAMN05216553_112154 [Lentzea fradiae]|uniref:Uncharacterized protein n=1 Tax=Lentzea fradiae TaxID=200378 RepID=A0A1G7XQ16_9PSEU|nr:hypothetical protein SAMN05216553_112154 [Lentzea fradiae]
MSDINELQNLADDESSEPGFTEHGSVVAPDKSTASIVC